MDMIPLLKIIAAVFLIFLLGGVGWALAHLKKIKRELIVDEAMPKSAPAQRILILIIAVLIGFSALLGSFLFYQN